ncbi:MacB-like periplasmic core domain protein [uncultured archaeon]|nr:MacB-like periplasmic core domain protein [uncultured archaeon]
MSSGQFLNKLAVNSLMKRKLRSWLTMLGVVIGVAAIVSLVSVATGMNQSISSRLNTFGANILQISPGGSQASRTGPGVFAGAGDGGGPREFDASVFGRQTATLTATDERLVKQVPGIAYASGTISGRATVSYKNKNASVTILGVDPLTYWQMTTANLSSGRLLSSSDTSSVIIGSRVYNQTFGTDLINEYVKIDGKSFHVVGELASSTSSFSSADDTIIMPISAAKSILNKTTLSSIMVSVADDADIAAVSDEITTALLSAHHVTSDKQDFTITSQESMQSTISSITGTMTLFLGGIGAISLLVGAIGVANTMFMSVLERTKEIGILKALGMTSGDITVLFLIESAMIGLIGGILGVMLSFVASYAMALFSIPSAITFELAALAVAFSALVGVASGVAPARNAARLEPIEALSYE